MKLRTWLRFLNTGREMLDEWVKGMPDLSFYPENVLRREAFADPVLFGTKHRADIGALIDLANLELLPFREAREGIRSALDADDPVKVYWGLIVCSSYGTEATEFEDRAVALCDHADLLVRTRAAEFLGLNGSGDPVPVIRETLYESKDGVEALLILNSLVGLMDGPFAYRFELNDAGLSPAVTGDPEVQRRLEYIHSRMGSTP